MVVLHIRKNKIEYGGVLFVIKTTKNNQNTIKNNQNAKREYQTSPSIQGTKTDV